MTLEDTNLSLVVTQAFGSQAKVSLGKFSILDAASGTPILGGGGLETFMNTAFAAPIDGVTPPYILGGITTYRTAPAIYTLMIYDPGMSNVSAHEAAEQQIVLHLLHQVSLGPDRDQDLDQAAPDQPFRRDR